jgi:hypothetical protein
VCFYSDDYPEFSNVRRVKARKPHRCVSCRETIPAGEEYEHHAGKYDGFFYSDKLCRRCCYDRNRIVEHELAEGCWWDESWPSFDEMAEYLTESGMGRTPPEDVPAGFNVGDMPKRPVEAASP